MWMGLTCGFLLYTAIATPAVIAFHWLDDVCSVVPTLYFDLALDVFFLLDIIMSFCMGVIYQAHYYDDPKWVANNYLCGSFLFDLCTSIPVSFVELSVKVACEAAAKDGDANSGIDDLSLRFIRAMKPLRYVKLARIMKLNKIGNLITTASDYCGLEPRHQRLMMLGMRIVGLIHMGGCAVWLVKILSVESEDVVHEFLESHGSPPLDTVDGKLAAYSLCTYFVSC